MNKIYIVHKQWYEEFYVYGVFLSKSTLESGLNVLAEEEIDDAKRSRKELQRWFDKTHTPWAEYHNIEPTRPEKLDMNLIEYSKSLFDITEIDADESISSPSPAGWYPKRNE